MSPPNPPPTQPDNSAPAGADASTLWLVSFGDDDDRELLPAQIAAALREGTIDGNTIVWRDGLSDWLPITSVPALAALLPSPRAAEEPTAPLALGGLSPPAPLPSRDPAAPPAAGVADEGPPTARFDVQQTTPVDQQALKSAPGAAPAPPLEEKGEPPAAVPQQGGPKPPWRGKTKIGLPKVDAARPDLAARKLEPVKAEPAVAAEKTPMPGAAKPPLPDRRPPPPGRAAAPTPGAPKVAPRPPPRGPQPPPREPIISKPERDGRAPPAARAGGPGARNIWNNEEDAEPIEVDEPSSAGGPGTPNIATATALSSGTLGLSRKPAPRPPTPPTPKQAPSPPAADRDSEPPAAVTSPGTPAKEAPGAPGEELPSAPTAAAAPAALEASVVEDLGSDLIVETDRPPSPDEAADRRPEAPAVAAPAPVALGAPPDALLRPPTAEHAAPSPIAGKLAGPSLTAEPPRSTSGSPPSTSGEPKKKSLVPVLLIGVAAVAALGFGLTQLRGGGQAEPPKAPPTTATETPKAEAVEPQKPPEEVARTADPAPAETAPAGTAPAETSAAAPAPEPPTTPVAEPKPEPVAAPAAKTEPVAKAAPAAKTEPVTKAPSPVTQKAEAPAKTTTPAPAKPAAPPAKAVDMGGDFDKAAATAALGAAAASASGCRKAGDPSGLAVVKVTFANSGKATRATIEGPPFAGTPTGGCIAAAMRAAKVPPFGGDRVTVTKRVVIQ